MQNLSQKCKLKIDQPKSFAAGRRSIAHCGSLQHSVKPPSCLGAESLFTVEDGRRREGGLCLRTNSMP